VGEGGWEGGKREADVEMERGKNGGGGGGRGGRDGLEMLAEVE